MAQIGNDIDGEAAGDQSGYSVSLNAGGDVVVIRAPYNNGAGADAGQVRISGSVPEIDIQGSGQSIADGDAVPSPADGTAFGSLMMGNTITHTFTISNNCAADLTLNGSPAVSLTTGAHFSVWRRALQEAPAAIDTDF